MSKQVNTTNRANGPLTDSGHRDRVRPCGCLRLARTQVGYFFNRVINLKQRLVQTHTHTGKKEKCKEDLGTATEPQSMRGLESAANS